MGIMNWKCQNARCEYFGRNHNFACVLNSQEKALNEKLTASLNKLLDKREEKSNTSTPVEAESVSQVTQSERKAISAFKRECDLVNRTLSLVLDNALNNFDLKLIPSEYSKLRQLVQRVQSKVLNDLSIEQARGNTSWEDFVMSAIDAEKKANAKDIRELTAEEIDSW